ncbi:MULTISPECIES: nitroreductase [Lactobacillaceae]|uniref:nitroreductase n=1 Tax=Lactobacillaceae TaxID=33958 RepID=UPI00145786D3|nr:nitroreductase [Lactobacillus sp. HBUAS51381]NLR09954.1 nitroreductase [Lactobacillus sp. HBUAS51381]
MDVYQALNERHATRWFTDQQIPKATLEKIISAAEKVPSWVNSQPYQVHVVTGKALQSIRQEHQHLGDVGEHGHSDLPVMARSDWSSQAQDNMKGWSEGIAKSVGSDWQKVMGDAAGKLYNAQAIVYLTLPEGYSEWSLYDLGAFGMALMLAAKDAGIDSMPAYQFVSFPEEVRHNIQLANNEKLIMGIGLGYRAADATVNRITSTRLPIDQMTTFHD